MTEFERIFGTRKPILGMVHFPPLPGSPLYNPATGMKALRDTALPEAIQGKTLVSPGAWAGEAQSYRMVIFGAPPFWVEVSEPMAA